MKIVFANDAVYGYASGAAVVGGAERQQWLLGRALAASGWSVTVGVRTTLERGTRQTIDGVDFLGIGNTHPHSDWYRFLRSEHPDWWYWRCANHLWGVAVEIARLARVRTIFAAGFDNDVRPRRALVRRARWWPLYAWGLTRTDRILVQHQGQLTGLSPRLRAKASIVPSIAADIPAGSPHRDRSPYVAWVAMLRQPKRPDVLVEIARRLPGVRFVVCGGATTFAASPRYGDQITNALRSLPNVEYLGAVAPSESRRIIADAALLLSTSDLEGFPNTFLEAWSSGTPVVSLQVDPDHIIERHRLGAVPGSVETAATEIASLVRAPQRRDEMGSRARRYVADAHSETAVAAIFERALKQPLREH